MGVDVTCRRLKAPPPPECFPTKYGFVPAELKDAFRVAGFWLRQLAVPGAGLHDKEPGGDGGLSAGG